MDASLDDLGNRRDKRANVYYVARLAALGDERRVNLLDVSPFGARVRTDLELEVGDEVHLSRAELRIPSRVVWSRANHFGLKFIEPAADQESIRALALPLGVQPT